MKKVLLFIVLKIVEIALMVAAYLGLCRLGWWLDSYVADPLHVIWYSPIYLFLMLSVIGVILLVIWLIFALFVLWIPAWFKKNKEWVDKILD